jgi:hypothetical protein
MGVKTLYFILREEDNLMVFENRVLRRNLALSWTRQEGRGGSSTVRSFVLLTKYHPGDQVKTNWVAGICGWNADREKHMRGFDRKLRGKSPFGRPRRRRELVLK